MVNKIKHDSQVFSVFAKQDKEGSYTITLLIKGIHCASCIQLIENALYEQEDVSFARINMSTQRLTINWQGKKERIDELVQIIERLGYQVKAFDKADNNCKLLEQEKFLLRCIAVAGFAMGNLMMISVGLWSSDAKTMGMATHDLFHFISALIGLPAILYAGRPFFSSAWKVLRNGHTNMDVPISVGVVLASIMSLFEVINHGKYIYFDSATMLLFFLLVGRFLDIRAKGKARESATELLSMLQGSATTIENGKQIIVPIRQLREGMIVLVAVGENIPTDGVIIEGASELDISLISGETIPKEVKEGEKVFAGTVNLLSPIKISVSKASENSLLSDIVKLMEKAEQGQARYVQMADKAARLYTPVVHILGLITFLSWWLLLGYDWQPSLLNAITVLIITCPCALGLAVPVVQVLASSKLMKQGILLKSGNALEKLALTDVAIFDKTGTLTVGKPLLINRNYSDYNLQVAASLAINSKHPLSRAISDSYKGELLNIENIKELPGKGLEGFIDKKYIRLGSGKWCGGKINNQNLGLQLWLSIEGNSPIQFIFSDPLRDDAKEVITTLTKSNITPILLSGDRFEVVRDMANLVGIKDYYAEFSPTEKYELLEELKQTGKYVLMVGDGLNDAPSLAAAHISISPSTAMDITQNAADIVFQGKSLYAVIKVWKIAKYSNKLVKENFILAVLYNLIAIPLAVMGYVTPLIAAISMSVSSLIVIGNSFRLNFKKGL